MSLLYFLHHNGCLCGKNETATVKISITFSTALLSKFIFSFWTIFRRVRIIISVRSIPASEKFTIRFENQRPVMTAIVFMDDFNDYFNKIAVFHLKK